MKIDDALQLAAETAGVGTWHLTVPEYELHSSPKCKEIFGLPPDAQFRYEDFLVFVHPGDRSLVEASVANAIDPKGTGLYELDYRIIHPDGSIRWLGGKGRAFFEEHAGEQVVTRFIGTVVDRTERRKIQDALIEGEKLAVMGRLAASIAHEIRNPLETVTNLLYLLRSEPSQAKRSDFIQQAEGELGRITEIATNTLRFYQNPTGNELFDLAELVETAVKLFQGRIATSRVSLEPTYRMAILSLRLKERCGRSSLIS